MPTPDRTDELDLLRRILDHDRVIDDLNTEIKAAEAELRDMRKRRAEAVAARAKLSAEIRKPTPLLGEKGGQ
jgi:hypothetical protein